MLQAIVQTDLIIVEKLVLIDALIEQLTTVIKRSEIMVTNGHRLTFNKGHYFT